MTVKYLMLLVSMVLIYPADAKSEGDRVARASQGPTTIIISSNVSEAAGSVQRLPKPSPDDAVFGIAPQNDPFLFGLVQLTDVPKVLEYSIVTNIGFRFAETVVSTKVSNSDKIPKQAIFSHVIPEDAMINEFSVDINGKRYDSFIEKIDERKYPQCRFYRKVPYTFVRTRNSKRFISDLILEPFGTVYFRLKYSEIINMEEGKYRFVLNLQPGQLVEMFHVKIDIREYAPLTSLVAELLPVDSFARGAGAVATNLIDTATLTNSGKALRFSPQLADQYSLICQGLNSESVSDGIAGQLLVSYDVDRHNTGGKGGVIMVDGCNYVSFFSPEISRLIRKHVIFVIETSESMSEKLDDIKRAVGNMLDTLDKDDLFDIIDFNSQAYVWGEPHPLTNPLICSDCRLHELEKTNISNLHPVHATPENIERGKRFLESMTVEGSADIYRGLEAALYFSMVRKKVYKDHAPIVLFISNGWPTSGETKTHKILYELDLWLRSVSKHDRDRFVPIYSVSFGCSVHGNFLKRLSVNSNGFYRHVHADIRATAVLERFFRSISQPMLHNIHYDGTHGLRRLVVGNYFNGTEIVTGEHSCLLKHEHTLSKVRVEGTADDGPKRFTLQPTTPGENFNGLWAHIKLRWNEMDYILDKPHITLGSFKIAKEASVMSFASSLIVQGPSGACVAQTRNAFYGYSPNFPTAVQGCAGSPGVKLFDICLLKPRLTGICGQKEVRWSYNVYTQKCDSFIYEGCGGNLNNFLTEVGCETQCVKN